MVTVSSSPPAADEANEPPLRSSSRDPNDPVPVAPPGAPGASCTAWPSVGAQPNSTPDCGPDSSQQLQPARACRPSAGSGHNAGGKQQEPVRSFAAAVAPPPGDRAGRVGNTQGIAEGEQSQSSG